MRHLLPYADRQTVKPRKSQAMDKRYYETIDRMQKSNVDPEYINGWASGFLHNPKREAQRANEAYEAGYSAGMEKNAGGFEAWVRK